MHHSAITGFKDNLIMEHIPVSGPWITDGEAEYVQDAARNAWYSKADMYHKRFAEAFAEYLDVQYTVPLPSCTSAIHLSLTALDIGPGDEVVLPDITWSCMAIDGFSWMDYTMREKEANALIDSWGFNPLKTYPEKE